MVKEKEKKMEKRNRRKVKEKTEENDNTRSKPKKINKLGKTVIVESHQEGGEGDVLR